MNVKALAPALAAFAVAAAIGTAIGAMVTRPHAAPTGTGEEHAATADSLRVDDRAPADSLLPTAPDSGPTRADSSRSASSHADSDTGAAGAATSTTGAGARVGELIGAREARTVSIGASGAVAPTDNAVRERAATSARPDFARLARLLSRMPAKDGARTLVQLSDAEAAEVLVAMPEKAAALLLAQLPAERTAALLRASMLRATQGGAP